MSRRQQIMDALANILSGIRKSAGYSTDLGENVRTWHPPNVPLSDQIGDAILLRDTEEQLEELDGKKLRHILRVETVILLSSESDEEMPVRCRAAIADLARCLGDYDQTMGDLIMKLTFDGGGEISINQAERVIGTIEMNLDLTYITDRKEW